MTLPSITPVDPPVETTLGHCSIFDIVHADKQQWMVVEHVRVLGDVVVVNQWRERHHRDVETPVRVVARVQLGGAK